MSKHTAAIRWQNTGPSFLKRQYSREHVWVFDGGATVPASASPRIVPAPWSSAAGVDPEEGFVAAVASCHMLWFLDVAISAGFEVETYEDAAEGVMTTNERGGLWISQITLRPCIQWSGAKIPTEDETAQFHHRAHEHCFIANSIKTAIVIEPSGS